MGDPPRRGDLDPPDTRTLSPVEDEVWRLIALAHEAMPQRLTAERCVSFMQRRFGLLGEQPATRESVARAVGVTRERLRQVEVRMFAELAARASSVPLPALEQVHRVTLAAAGRPWSWPETLLGPLLGRVPLEAALRIFRATRPNAATVSRGKVSVAMPPVRIPVVVAAADDRSVLPSVARAAHELVRLGGAGDLSDLQRLACAVGQRDLDVETVSACLEVLPGFEWLDVPGELFWFRTESLPPLLRRVALVLALARAPVSLAVLHDGLQRGAARKSVAQAARFATPITEVALRSLLERHPSFRSAAGSYALAVPFNPQAELAGFYAHLVAELERHGGVASLATLGRLAEGERAAASADHLAQSLSFCPFIERIAHQTYAIRGRPLSPAAIRKAVGERRTRAGNDRRPEEANFRAVFTITPGLCRRGNASMQRSSTPANVAGTYALPCGSTCRIAEDAHGVRLTAFGAIRDAVRAAPGGTLEIRGDTALRTLTYRAWPRGVPIPE